MKPQPRTKLSILREYMADNNWRAAVALASKFPQLGEHKEAIQRAQMAYTNPAFCRGIKREPAELIQAGIAALQARYQA